jgi:hypothetical protein
MRHMDGGIDGCGGDSSKLIQWGWVSIGTGKG